MCRGKSHLISIKMFEMQQLASECPVYGHSKLDRKVFHHSTANGLSLNETISILELKRHLSSQDNFALSAANLTSSNQLRDL